MNGIASHHSNTSVSALDIELRPAISTRKSTLTYLALSLLVHLLALGVFGLWQAPSSPKTNSADTSKPISIKLKNYTPSPSFTPSNRQDVQTPSTKGQEGNPVSSKPVLSTSNSVNSSERSDQEPIPIASTTPETARVSIHAAIAAEKHHRHSTDSSDYYQCSRLERRQKSKNCDRTSNPFDQIKTTANAFDAPREQAGAHARREKIDRLKLLNELNKNNESIKDMMQGDISDLTLQLNALDLESSMTLRAEKICPDCTESFKDNFN